MRACRETHPAGTTGSPGRRAGGGRATRRLTATTPRRGDGVELQPPPDERPSRRPSLAQRVSPPDPRTADARWHRGRRRPTQPDGTDAADRATSTANIPPAHIHESATSDGQKLTAGSGATTGRAGCDPPAPRDRVWTDSFIPLARRRCALATPACHPGTTDDARKTSGSLRRIQISWRPDRGRRRESAGDLSLAGRCQRASAACPPAPQSALPDGRRPLNRPGVRGDSWPWKIKDGVHGNIAHSW